MCYCRYDRLGVGNDMIGYLFAGYIPMCSIRPALKCVGQRKYDRL